MKEWQRQKLSDLLDHGVFLNRHAWLSGTVGALFILTGTWLELIWSMYAGGILLAAGVCMMFATDIILWYVKWRKKTWK
jgi:hypothetical protein